MSHLGNICAIVIVLKNPFVETVFDQARLSEGVGSALVSKLCSAGVLKRDHERLVVGNLALAKRYAEQIDPAPAQNVAPPHSVAPPPAIEPSPPVRTKWPVIPIPAKIEVRTGVPCPPPRVGGRPVWRCPWPFPTMKFGDSFVIDVPVGFEAREVAYNLSRDVVRYKKLVPLFRAAVRIAEDSKSVGLWREEALPGQRATAGKRAAKAGQ